MSTTARRLIAVTAATGLAFGIATPVLAEATPTTPKNVIVMISDGAGYNQFDAASLYESGTSYRQVAVDPSTGAITLSAATPTQVYEQFPVQVAQDRKSVV